MSKPKPFNWQQFKKYLEKDFGRLLPRDTFEALWAKKSKKALNGYLICVSNDASGFKAKATEENNSSGCIIELFADSRIDRSNQC